MNGLTYVSVFFPLLQVHLCESVNNCDNRNFVVYFVLSLNAVPCMNSSIFVSIALTWCLLNITSSMIMTIMLMFVMITYCI